MIPLLILGLLIQNPGAHGYELLALMEKRHYKYIVNFTKGSFYYNLQQLEEKGWIEQIQQNSSISGRETRNFIITESGMSEFEKLMVKYGTKSEYVNLQFYGALLFADDYDKNKLLELIQSQIDQTKTRIALLDEYLSKTQELPGTIDYYRRMNENSRSHHLVNLEWFEQLRAEIEGHLSRL
ncbi:DNA-binding PadR family transcriptional regulator [Paenibacillus rhizosphaerae]|uniref:DNA-binding PadR family transcriptional regulator n=1 Tax=Paenibacillus rhizosphaerae TaxID=297318 RepID=A0A839TPK3_9BACL|nr:helix-turn-helix transcriptional regulator [Paenibacillus rhizosphaerae]MBB3128642.1 DNA-binding PadR family transcriptional regulator [Paenibacillus rhizosphaerae]